MEPLGVNSPGAASAPDGAIDLIGLFAALRARKRWILIPTLVSLVAALAFVMLVSQRYTGVAKILLESQESYFTRPAKAAPESAAPYDSEAVQSAAEAIATPNLARKAVDILGLSERAEFNPARSSN